MNLELNVVRFENEDVITTSCDVNLQTALIMHVIRDIDSNDVSYVVYEYNSEDKGFKCIDNGKTTLDKCPKDVAEGNLLHIIGNKYEVCKDPTAHTLIEDE